MLRPFCVVKLGDHSVLFLTLKDGSRGGRRGGGSGREGMVNGVNDSIQRN